MRVVDGATGSGEPSRLRGDWERGTNEYDKSGGGVCIRDMCR
jgi:hypothetical protein